MKKRIIMVLVMMLTFTSIFIQQPTPTYASSTSNVNNMLSAYKKHHYITAEKYAKRLTSTKDASERKMTSSMKKAFKSVSKRYKLTGFSGIYFVDMDGDNKSEMLVLKAPCLGNMTTYVYKYTKGKAVYVGKFDCGHSQLINYPGHKGLICHFAHMAYEVVSTVCLRNGKIHWTTYGERDVGFGDYLTLKPLNNHLSSSGALRLGF